jgi:hypothetical protein
VLLKPATPAALVSTVAKWLQTGVGDFFLSEAKIN